MKKKSILFCSLMAIAGLTSCAEPKHTHTFSENYVYDETNHWLKATCSHTELTKDLAEHDFGNDNICIVCGYAKPTPAHEHAYSNEWTQNDYMHWRGALCEHSELSKDLGEHTYDENGFCTVCNYETPDHFRRLDFDVRNATVQGNTRLRFNSDVTFTIVPNEGYKLPLTVTPIGFSNYTYNSETGVFKGKVTGDKAKISSRAILLTNNFVISKDSFINLKNETGYIEEHHYDKTAKHLKIEYKDHNSVLLKTLEYDYNDKNEKIRESEYNVESNITKLINFTYNEKGLLIKEEASDNQTGEFVVNSYIEYTYLDNGRLENKNTYREGSTDWFSSEQHTYVESGDNEYSQVIETVSVMNRDYQGQEPYLITKTEYLRRDNGPFYDEFSVVTTEYIVGGESVTAGNVSEDYYLKANGKLREHRENGNIVLWIDYTNYQDVNKIIHYTTTGYYDPYAGWTSSTYIDKEETFYFDEYQNVKSYVCDMSGYNDIYQSDYLIGEFMHNENDLLVEAKYTHYLHRQVLTRNIDYVEVDEGDFVPLEMKRGVCVENYEELCHKDVMDF